MLNSSNTVTENLVVSLVHLVDGAEKDNIHHHVLWEFLKAELKTNLRYPKGWKPSKAVGYRGFLCPKGLMYPREGRNNFPAEKVPPATGIECLCLLRLPFKLSAAGKASAVMMTAGFHLHFNFPLRRHPCTILYFRGASVAEGELTLLSCN